ncbi:MAG: GNAT family N-acetyltransferase [bacterium]|jgi:RimJ/RimL family protein N-acetyltransferase
MSQFDPGAIVLAGQLVRLEPLKMEHAEELYRAGQDDEIWRYMPCPRQQETGETAVWIQQALQEQALGTQVPFVIINQMDNKMIGSTRYLDIQRQDSNLEIGWTWIGKPWQRTGVNTECKYLLLSHAFEELGAVRAQLKTDGRNIQSQKAMERLGFVREGVLRRQRLCWDGHYRDTVYYSVLDTEWQQVKKHILTLMKKY